MNWPLLAQAVATAFLLGTASGLTVSLFRQDAGRPGGLRDGQGGQP